MFRPYNRSIPGGLLVPILHPTVPTGSVYSYLTNRFPEIYFSLLFNHAVTINIIQRRRGWPMNWKGSGRKTMKSLSQGG
jgi:hypothetical protein